MAPPCVGCDTRKSMVRFTGESFPVEHAGMHVDVKGLSGWRCSACGEIVFNAESAKRYAKAGDDLVLKARKRQQEEISRIRRKLGLTQEAAAGLTGGGHNAFSRYERGEAEPLPAIVNLLKLLDRHPELLAELRSPERAGTRTRAKPARSRKLAMAGRRRKNAA